MEEKSLYWFENGTVSQNGVAFQEQLWKRLVIQWRRKQASCRTRYSLLLKGHIPIIPPCFRRENSESVDKKSQQWSLGGGGHNKDLFSQSKNLNSHVRFFNKKQAKERLLQWFPTDSSQESENPEGSICAHRHHPCPCVPHYGPTKPFATPRMRYASLNCCAFVLFHLSGMPFSNPCIRKLPLILQDLV